MNFSIVIPTWNRSALVVELLKSLYEDRKIYKYGETEVLIIDSSEGNNTKYDCPDCGSYYYFNNYYDENGDHIKSERLISNTLTTSFTTTPTFCHILLLFE